MSKAASKRDSNYGGITTNNNLEFGGPVGVAALMIWSHYILYYFYYCWESYEGNWIIPMSLDEALSPAWYSGEISKFYGVLCTKCVPGVETWLAYTAFFVVQLVLAAIVPGMMMEGLPTSDGSRLPYLCNGYLCYYICIYGVIFTSVFFPNIWDISKVYDKFGEYLTAAVIVADVTSLFWYLYGIKISTPEQRQSHTGNVIYDFFMGTILYPRVGPIVDIKMIAEVRWSWLTLMLLTMSCAYHQYKESGHLTNEMMVMLLAHWLYSNATVKGEHCIPCTWDMFHENFGWMLNFWNIAGVPYLYCFQSFYIAKNYEKLERDNINTFGIGYIPAVTVLLIVGYYIFDSANCQKASIKIPGLKRNTFPQVPWGVLQEPIRYIHTPKGKLLVDGWYAFVRKLQYTGDIVMAICWGLVCGSPWRVSSDSGYIPLNVLPYFYSIFFTGMITHRQLRDEVRCKEKYGEYWDMYTTEVPNVFLPGSKFFSWLLSSDKTLKPISTSTKSK